NEDLQLLNIRKGITDKDKEEPHATKNIPDMIKYIKSLIEKNYAYVTNTGVYFSVRAFKDYGKLSGQSPEQMQSGARKEPDETKKDPLDFALWKTSKPNEPSWESPWGAGRPGWHIECSVMSQKFLKCKTLDIHAGGRDLIFPHHENETAQAEALTGKLFASYWIHHGLLTINGQKMAKSLGNFITIKTALKDLPKANAADILKDFFICAHYSSPVDYSAEKIADSKEAMWGLLETLERSDMQINLSGKDAPEAVSEFGYINKWKTEFQSAMDDDFNTPQARAIIFELKRYCNLLLDKKEQAPEAKKAIQYAHDAIYELGRILGFSFNKIDSHDLKWSSSKKDLSISEEEIAEKIKQRNDCRKNKKYKDADEIRKGLETRGIALDDGLEGTTWRPI
ncbi:MAG: cysteine--tRNA ligase, partial [Candidatus Omnitrophica bacterium]|nr:cysteine--tRNA ligase [Candidatus Omnitrophota bacterium]